MTNQESVVKMSVSAVCRRLKMSRQNYYTAQRQRTRRRVEAEELAVFTRGQRQQHPRMGCRKILYLYGRSLPGKRETIGRDRAFEELGARGLLVPRKRGKPRTTQSSHNLPLVGNRIADLKVDGVNQVWVSDLTYLQTRQGPMYLSLITDKYSRQIQGYHVTKDLRTEGCLEALKMALKKLPPGHYPIHHSDRGCQYASHAYAQELKERGLTASMTEKDHCAENALAERMNGILKQEYELDAVYLNREDVKRAVSQSVSLYNEGRPHQALGYETPNERHNRKQKERGSSWRPAPAARN